MSGTLVFVGALVALVGGIGVAVLGGLQKNDALLSLGSWMAGAALGALGIKRPQDYERIE